jgi:hypothetical protein
LILQDNRQALRPAAVLARKSPAARKSPEEVGISKMIFGEVTTDLEVASVALSTWPLTGTRARN